MKAAAVPNLRASMALAVFLLIANLGNALYAMRGVKPSASFVLLCYVGVAALVAYWIGADCRRLGVPKSIDQGWFVLTCWPLALPYHLFKTRRAKGLATLAGFAALFVGCYLVSILFFFAVRSRGAR